MFFLICSSRVGVHLKSDCVSFPKDIIQDNCVPLINGELLDDFLLQAPLYCRFGCLDFQCELRGNIAQKTVEVPSVTQQDRFLRASVCAKSRCFLYVGSVIVVIVFSYE